jgi:hypothetical protein
VSESSAAKSSVDVETVHRALGILVLQDSVAELRAPNTYRRGTVSGYFNDLGKMADSAGALSGKAAGVYVTLNPVKPELLARASNHVVRFASHTTGDADIVRLWWFLIDFDPVRPAGISATDAEHEAALQRAGQCREWLRAEGWPEPVFADSGNGGHLAYRVDLANTSENTQMLRSCLLALGPLFSDSTVQVDPSTYNAARIVKVCGTLAAKGDSLPSRPHRLSRPVDVPPEPQPVSVDLLVGLAARVPRAEPQAQAWQSRSKGNGVDLERWIVDHRLPVDGPTTWNGGRRWVFEVCPFNPEHRNRSAYIVQFPSGAIKAGCLHKGCEGKDWHALRDWVEADWRIHSAQRKDGDLGSRPVTASDGAKPEAPLVLPERVWRGPFGDYRKAMKNATEAPDAYHFSTLLVRAGMGLGRRVRFYLGMWIYCNFYCLNFGDTGDRKTTAQRQLPMLGSEPVKMIEGAGSGEGLADQFQTLRPGSPCVISLEEFSELLRRGRWDGSTLIQFLTTCWDCRDRYEVPFRKKPINLELPTPSLLAGTTPEWFWADLRLRDMAAGFGNRLQYWTGKKKEPIPLPAEPDLANIRSQIDKLAKVPEGNARLAPKARELWEDFYNAWEEEQKKRAPMLRKIVERLPAYVIKTAMVYAGFEKSLPEIINEQLEAAILVGNFNTACAEELLSLQNAGSNPRKELERRIVAFVAAHPPKTTKHYTYKALWRHYPDAVFFDQVFNGLARAGELRVEPQVKGRVDVGIP